MSQMEMAADRLPAAIFTRGSQPIGLSSALARAVGMSLIAEAVWLRTSWHE